jgi:hypothetical protein
VDIAIVQRGGISTVSGKIIGAVGAVASIAGAAVGYYYITTWLPAHSISKEPIGSPILIMSWPSANAHVDQAKRINVVYVSTSTPDLNWTSDWYPLDQIGKMMTAVDIRYAPGGSTRDKAMNSLMKAHINEALGVARRM